MGCISKFGLIIINFIVVVLGLTTVGVSATLIHQQSIYGVLVTGAFFSLPLCSLLGGIFITILGILGLYGAIKEQPCILMVYAVMVGISMVLVLGAGIGIFVLTVDTTGSVANTMFDAFDKYGDPDYQDLTADIDHLQNTAQCCGIYGYEDWGELDYGNGTDVGDGCCINQTEGCGAGMLDNPEAEDLVYTMGCVHYIVAAVYYVSITLGIVTLISAFFQILSISLACILASDTRRKRKKITLVTEVSFQSRYDDSRSHQHDPEKHRGKHT